MFVLHKHQIAACEENCLVITKLIVRFVSRFYETATDIQLYLIISSLFHIILEIDLTVWAINVSN